MEIESTPLFYLIKSVILKTISSLPSVLTTSVIYPFESSQSIIFLKQLFYKIKQIKVLHSDILFEAVSFD